MRSRAFWYKPVKAAYGWFKCTPRDDGRCSAPTSFAVTGPLQVIGSVHKPNNMDRKQLTIREVALKALHRIETRNDVPRDALNALFQRHDFSNRDRAFATEMVYGTIRWKRWLDWILSELMTRNLSTVTPWIHQILRMGLYQLMFMDRVPQAAATHEAVEMARRYGHAGTARLTNALLRSAIRKREGFHVRDLSSNSRKPAGIQTEEPSTYYLGVTHSYPDWLVRRWVDRYDIAGATALMEAGNQKPPVSIRMNPACATKASLTDSLNRHGICVESGRWLDDFLLISNTGNLTRLPDFTQGRFQVQDESAGLAVRLLEPKPGETVVDLCCAPGGKMTYIAQIMRSRGKVIACDPDLSRMRRVLQNHQRLGLGGVCLLIMDGRRPALRMTADRVLVDAPCSGLGAIARRPDLRWRRRPEDIERLRCLQFELLERASDLVRVSGVLVYSTCTIEPEENEDVVDAFCRKHPEFRLEQPASWPERLTGIMKHNGMISTLPSVHGIDGSFAARMRKVA